MSKAQSMGSTGTSISPKEAVTDAAEEDPDAVNGMLVGFFAAAQPS